MSYREVRNFTEIMRALGYPHPISMENFRTPNFELVADILYWMVNKYDPDTTLSDAIELEEQRISFLTHAASILAGKARIKLNTKKLYAADGRSVQELLKFAVVLNKAMRTVSKSVRDKTPPPSIKVQDIKIARQLASEITQSGASLYDMLVHENEDRNSRSRATRFLDLSTSAKDGAREQQYIERSIREIIDQTKQTLDDMKKESEELEADKSNMDKKIQKKKDELERTEKRLKSLESVKPQFMEEAEKLERELQKYYEIYMDKYRNLDYLEHELDKHRQNEVERKEEHDRKLEKMRERLMREEVELMRGQSILEGKSDTVLRNNNNKAGRFGQGYGAAQVHGSMNKVDNDDDESSEGSQEDDDDEQLSFGDKYDGNRQQNRKYRDEDDEDDDDDDEDDDVDDDDDFDEDDEDENF